MPAIDIAAYGWEFAEGFYPEDLPPQWRLSYYANAHDAVVVPLPLWSSATNAQLTAWASEGNERFSLYWELPAEPASAHQACVRLAPFCADAGGLLLPAAAGALSAGSTPHDRCPHYHLVPDGAPCAAARHLALHAPATLPALRAGLERLCRCATERGLVICADAATLQQATLVARLLGVSRSG